MMGLGEEGMLKRTDSTPTNVGDFSELWRGGMTGERTVLGQSRGAFLHLLGWCVCNLRSTPAVLSLTVKSGCN